MTAFDGKWRITWMEEWDADYIDMDEPGHFSIVGDEGSFVFGMVRGEIDARVFAGGRKMEFSWEGICEGDHMSGRGWLELRGPGVAEGRLFIHHGEESGFQIEKI